MPLQLNSALGADSQPYNTAPTAEMGAARRSLHVAAAVLVAHTSGALPMYPGSPWPAAYTAQAQAKLASLSLENKFTLMRGTIGALYVGYVAGNASLGLPPLNLEDGPQGVADEALFVTAWPSALTAVMTWNTSAMQAFGAAMGAEQYLKGTNVALAPAVNLARVPWGGRTFEYQGEDPYLASVMSSAEIVGIQSNNISACIKHYVANSQEYDRNSMSSNVGRRPYFELYTPAFAAAVAAGVGSAMCSYNRINNTWACENNATLSDLYDRFGFRGWMMSDWGACHSAVGSALAGMGQEMPYGVWFTLPLEAAVASGQVPTSCIDNLVLRLLTPMYALGLIADQPTPAHNILTNASSDAHNALARELAEQSITLLQNNAVPGSGSNASFLPLDAASLLASGGSVAVLGDDTTVHGGGSGGVIPPYVITPSQGIAGVLGPTAHISSYTGQNVSYAAQLAASATVAVVNVAISSSEGSDRPDLSLPPWQDALVAAVAAANPRTVVVVRCPGACFMPWRAAVPSILYQLMPGQESGNALARAIFGLVNPSGKLPVSFPATMNDTWLSSPPGGPINPLQYPGTDRGRGWVEVDYTEGLLIGYRWYDAQAAAGTGLQPLFPFGHGLSYTSFTYSGLSITGSISHDGSGPGVNVSMLLSNAGAVGGAEVVQLYVSHPPALGEPPKVLRGFQKVYLPPGASTRLSFGLTAQDVAVFDLVADDWAAVPGAYGLLLGSSSADLRLTGSFNVL